MKWLTDVIPDFSCYLDNNSTTAILPAVVDAMQSCWQRQIANPSSSHRLGQAARQALEQARQDIACSLDAPPASILFTSGATESNNLALFGMGNPLPGCVLTTRLEHPSVAEPLLELAKRSGHEMQFLTHDDSGRILPAGTPPLERVRLVSVQWANHETGTLQSIAALSQGMPGVPFHCDAAQAVGRVPVSFRQSGATTLSFSAHKFHGPQGVGGLLVKPGVALRPLLRGGPQQRETRPGTEPVALIVGMAKALTLAVQEMADRSRHISELRAIFLTRLAVSARPFQINGPEVGGVPHTLNLSFPGCDAAILLMRLDRVGIACSMGSACATGALQPSPVLTALGLPAARVRSALRFSLSHLLTQAEVLHAADLIGRETAALRRSADDME